MSQFLNVSISQFLFFSGSIDAYPGKKGSNEVLDKHD